MLEVASYECGLCKELMKKKQNKSKKENMFHKDCFLDFIAFCLLTDFCKIGCSQIYPPIKMGQ